MRALAGVPHATVGWLACFKHAIAPFRPCALQLVEFESQQLNALTGSQQAPAK